MTCACDTHDCANLSIAAGLNVLPRAPGMFGEWRRELLAAIGRERALDKWSAREAGDLGLMMVDFFAYVGDVGGFYDALTAEASYLGTVTQPGGARRLVGLLGYKPRPAFASSVWLAAEADGVRTVVLPRGTAFRSGAFPGSAPQVFELDAEAVVEPRVNRLAIDRVPDTDLPDPMSGITVLASTVRVSPGQLIVLASDGGLAPARVLRPRAYPVRTRQAVTMLDFAAPVSPPAGATYANTRLLRAGARCGTWKLAPAAGDTAVFSTTALSLDGHVAIQPGDIVIIEGGPTAVARTVTAVEEAQYQIAAGGTSTLTDSAQKVTTLVSPPIRGGTTRITLDSAMPFSASDATGLTIHYAMSEAATLHAPLKDTLAVDDPVVLPGLIDAPRTSITEVALEDAHGEGVVTSGTLDAATHTASLSDTPYWGKEMAQPVTLHGNVFAATRGETVAGELLGIGDGSLPLQTFRLKKKPLTYLAAANSAGRTSSLVIHVGGIAWSEADNFYGRGEHDRVYVVRHNEAGEAYVDFGGGARLPTGAQVIADYRFGAGAASPPANSVRQLAKPVAGLRTVRNVLPAYGGADAEGPDETIYRGPASALLLGRAISLVDLEAAAANRTGVRAARAAWRWDALGLRPAVEVRYIGDQQLAPPIRAALRALAEDDAPITVLNAAPQPAKLDVDIAVDPEFVADDVADAVGKVLFAAATLPGTGGLLTPEKLGPDGVVFASIVVQAIMAVPGVAGLNSMSFDDTTFSDIARAPAAGAYFDFADGGIRINGRSAG